VVATSQAGAGDVAAAQAGPTGDPLGSWREGATKQAIVDFVQRVTTEGPPDFVPPQERVAVFDNDGTLWCEKPMPIQLDFILRRLVVMADQDPGAAHPPTLGRAHLACGYVPMVELLGYLEAAGFRNYIASGGGRDFMRPISQELYGVPRQRVIGSSVSLAWEDDGAGGRLVRNPEVDAPRRPGPRVRLHRRCRAGTPAGPQQRLDRDQHQERLGDRVLMRRR
jgi:hypothetical protein